MTAVMGLLIVPGQKKNRKRSLDLPSLKRYSHFVRELKDGYRTFPECSLGKTIPTPDLTQPPLLPNLRSLDSYNFNPDIFRLFANSSVEQAYVGLECGADNSSNIPMLKNVSSRMPNLKRLTLASMTGHVCQDSAETLTDMCRGLPLLEYLVTPGIWLLPQCAAVGPLLASLTALHITMSDIGGYDGTMLYQYRDSFPQFSISHFPSLRLLTVTIRYDMCRSYILVNTNIMTQLTELKLETVRTEGEDSFRETLNMIPTACPNLESLRCSKPTSRALQGSPLTYDTIKLLRRIPSLRVVEITVAFPIKLSVDDFVLIFRQLKNLTYLRISSPDHLPTITFEHLESIIPRARHLEQLAVDLIPLKLQAVGDRRRSVEMDERFQMLRRVESTSSMSLDIRSLSGDIGATTRRLKGILPVDCMFDHGDHPFWMKVASMLAVV
ncbi:hypothetical protein ONZ45_g4016 [Pleurotus djamor]|nr:hypothetical protein ONZ45_g4016 [Pleurotus djamor]